MGESTVSFHEMRVLFFWGVSLARERAAHPPSLRTSFSRLTNSICVVCVWKRREVKR